MAGCGLVATSQAPAASQGGGAAEYEAGECRWGLVLWFRFGGPAGGRSRRRSGDRDGTEVRVAVMAVCWTLRAGCGAGLLGCGSARAVTAVELVPLRRLTDRPS
jgi:hypothetical protein